MSLLSFVCFAAAVDGIPHVTEWFGSWQTVRYSDLWQPTDIKRNFTYGLNELCGSLRLTRCSVITIYVFWGYFVTTLLNNTRQRRPLDISKVCRLLDLD